MGETLDGQICVGICVRERNEGVTLALRQQVSRKTGKENLQDNASRKSGPGIQEKHVQLHKVSLGSRILAGRTQRRVGVREGVWQGYHRPDQDAVILMQLLTERGPQARFQLSAYIHHPVHSS